MLKKKKYAALISIIVLVLISSISCVPKNKLVYFNDINELDNPAVNPRIQKPIMPFDRLFVRVVSIDPSIAQIFNDPMEMRYGGAGSTQVGYLVDERGNINFPFVGDINVGNLTTAQAAEKMEKAMSDYVTGASMVVRYIDNQVTLLGEVNSSGVYNFSRDKLTIYEAIGLGGGITRYGDRRNIILIRNEDDRIMHHRLNLSDSKIASQSYYYVLPNDIVIVEPLRAISSSYSNITYTTVLSSVTTAIAILLFIGIRP